MFCVSQYIGSSGWAKADEARQLIHVQLHAAVRDNLSDDRPARLLLPDGRPAYGEEKEPPLKHVAEWRSPLLLQELLCMEVKGKRYVMVY